MYVCTFDIHVGMGMFINMLIRLMEFPMQTLWKYREHNV